MSQIKIYRWERIFEITQKNKGVQKNDIKGKVIMCYKA